MSPGNHCALARANRVSCTDERHIRTRNTVIVNPKQGAGVLYKIVDCLRTVSRPRNIATLQNRYR
jgi:hypothetical protein